MAKFVFELPTDSVEFFEDDLLAVGMYKLHEDSCARQGRIAFLERREEDTIWERTGQVELNGGLLDMKWKRDGWVAATSEDVSLGTTNRIRTARTLDSGINLCVDVKAEDIFISTSTGNIFQLDGDLTEKASWKAHDMETWCVSALQEEHMVATGADDFSLKLWDTRNTCGPVATSKAHQAGVCSVVPLEEHLIATGSYDKQLRIFDLRNIRQPLSSVSFSSGVWRIKRSGDRLLLGCMHDGFHIVDWKSAAKLWHYPSGSLAYGCSWSANGLFTAGASFYDCAVNIFNA